MDTPLRPLSGLASTLRPWIFGFAVVVGLGFYFLISHAMYGWPLALFSLLVAAGTILTAIRAKGLRNPWALGLLIPLLSACVSTSLYSSDAIKPIGFFTITLSLAALAYWLVAPSMSWRKGVPVWNIWVFLQSALPFRQYQALFSGSGESNTKKLNAKLVIQVTMGLVIAFPVLILFFALFTDGDRFFQQTLGNWFRFDFVTDDIVRLVFSLLTTVFASAFFWNIARRSRDEMAAKEPRAAFQEIIATRSFLTAIAALFVIFAGFQLYYLFQGSSYILSRGETYANYAVSGYVQLCLAAGFAFIILLAVYHLTQMKDRWVRITSITIAVTSFISTISAGKRLWLYVDAYGLTLSRLWGAQVLFVILALFVLLVISVRRSFNAHQVITFGTMGVLGLLSISLLLNQEALVARYNLSHVSDVASSKLDTRYLTYSLSSDAVPAIVNSLERLPKNLREDIQIDLMNRWEWEKGLPYGLSKTGDPRMLSLSDLRIDRALAQLRRVSP